LKKKLVELVKLRASQVNGCGYCVNLHSKDARKAGETEQRVYAVAPGGKPLFLTPAEQAALKLAEEITRIAEEVYPKRPIKKPCSILEDGRGAADLYHRSNQ